MTGLIKKENVQLSLLLLAALFFFTLNIWSIPVTDGDSAFYAKIAKNMVQTGDWLTLRHLGDPTTNTIDKPPFVMWLIAASFKIFGINEFALTFWHSILSVLTLLITYLAARELFGRKTAVLSAIILLTSLEFFYMARSPLLDMPLTFFASLSLYFYLLFDRKKGLVFFYLTPAAMALAMLCKGPVGVALPALIILIYLIVCRKMPFSSLKSNIVHIMLGIAVFIAAALPWYIAEFLTLGRKFLEVEFSHNFGRYLRPIDATNSAAGMMDRAAPQYDFYQYFAQLFFLVAPWSGFVYPSMFYSFRKKEMKFPLIWAMTVLLFFSLSLNFKIARYILPAFPALAIMMGKLVSDWLDNNRAADRYVKIANFTTLFFIAPVLLLLIIAIIANANSIVSYYMPIIMPFLIIMCLALITGSLFYLKGKKIYSIFSYASIALIAYFMLILTMTIYLPTALPIKHFAEKINLLAKNNTIACQYKGSNQQFMAFYIDGRFKFVNKEDELKDLLNGRAKVYGITEDKKTIIKLRVKILEEKGAYVLFSN